MIQRTLPDGRKTAGLQRHHVPLASNRKDVQTSSGYGRKFWLGYLSNALFCAATGMLFRYADFVNALGGDEWHLGWILGVGMIGSLATRIGLGSGIDRYGTRIMWVGSLVLFAIVCFSHLLVNSHTGIWIYILRIAFCSAWAGVYGAAFTFGSQQAPPNRMAEFYGMIGTATFVGVFAGTQLSDILTNFGDAGCTGVNLLFVGAGLLAMIAIPLAWAATQGEKASPPALRQSAWQVLRLYHPMANFFIAGIMGMAVGTTNLFLRAYVKTLGISKIGLFFSLCAITVVAVRVPTREWPARFGNNAMIVLGTCCLALSQLSFLIVTSEWQLVIPAVMFGVSQALLFPSVTAAGSVAFPAERRGLATALMLASSDFGLLVGGPLLSCVYSCCQWLELPPYSAMFIVKAAILVAAAVFFVIINRRPVRPWAETPE